MMGGFQDHSLNTDFKLGLYHIIVLSIIKSCELMVKNDNAKGITIENREEKIRTHLLENFLDNDKMRSDIGLAHIPLRFSPENLENYDPSSDTYVGRTDIKVVSNSWFHNRNDYYTIECKRIDGTKLLNKEYINEGVCRYIGKSPKYSSYNGKNFMLGFVVKKIDCSNALADISTIHIEKLKKYIKQDIMLVEKTDEYCFCESKYSNGLLLAHIFYDLSNVVA